MLEVGLLWFDADRRRTARDKLEQAAARYQSRFARRPNVCQVHPADLFAHDSIAVVANPAVLRDHFWVGVDRELDPPPPPRRRAARPSVPPVDGQIGQPAASPRPPQRRPAAAPSAAVRLGQVATPPVRRSRKPSAPAPAGRAEAPSEPRAAGRPGEPVAAPTAGQHGKPLGPEQRRRPGRAAPSGPDSPAATVGRPRAASRQQPPDAGRSDAERGASGRRVARPAAARTPAPVGGRPEAAPAGRRQPTTPRLRRAG
jgi:hypothetical protein